MLYLYMFVGFASIDVVCDELNDCVWYLGCCVVVVVVYPHLHACLEVSLHTLK